MSTILYVIRYFGPSAESVTPAAPPPEADEGAAPIEDGSDEEEDPFKDKVDEN